MKIALFGAGQMGGGIAQVCAVAGHSVSLYDSAEGRVNDTIDRIEADLNKLVEGGKLDAGKASRAIELISAQSEPDDWAFKSDFVIEAITEDLEAKRALFAQIAPHAHANTILASNTSSYPITSLAQGWGNEDRFIGIHFMNPVALMPLVEIISGVKTSAETLDKARKLVENLGKKAVVAADYPGFIANRILMPLINEAAFALMEGVGSLGDIDETAKLGLNHPMGPLELADLIGLDTCVAILRTLHQGHGDPKFRPCPLMVRLAEAGHLGRKSGRGFYDYSSKPPKPAA